ncbi:type II secretion system minor pseudopilin GspI [Aestuariibacter sp. A3R04]|nr:type II secretion system minor pseudopilin GspI [Aestuariibacter sp. A3R04]
MTLLEVMAALAIFALAGTAVMKAASEHLNSVSRVEETTFATWVANNRLNHIKLTANWPPKNNVRGTAEMADRTWYWQQVVKKTTDDDLRAVEISVGTDDQYEYFDASVVTYLARPAALPQNDTGSSSENTDNINSNDDNSDEGTP